MKTVNDMYNEYIDTQRTKLKEYKDKEVINTSGIAYLFSLLGSLKDILRSSKVTYAGLSNIYNNKDINLVIGGNTTIAKYYSEDDITTIKSLNEVRASSAILQQYVRALISLARERNRLKDIVSMLEIYSSVTFNIFKHSIEEYNLFAQELILKGESVEIASKVGHIYIEYIDRQYVKNGKEVRKVVDWGNSLKVLFDIAQTQEHDGLHKLYSKRANKEISKREFIDAMKPYVYSEATPSLPKWLVYVTDDGACWIRWKKFKALFTNRSEYSFVPTNYIHNETRSQIDFAKNAKSIDDIIKSRLLGFRDKLNILLKYDISYTNTFKHDLQ